MVMTIMLTMETMMMIAMVITKTTLTLVVYMIRLR